MKLEEFESLCDEPVLKRAEAVELFKETRGGHAITQSVNRDNKYVQVSIAKTYKGMLDTPMYFIFKGTEIIE